MERMRGMEEREGGRHKPQVSLCCGHSAATASQQYTVIIASVSVCVLGLCSECAICNTSMDWACGSYTRSLNGACPLPFFAPLLYMLSLVLHDVACLMDVGQPGKSRSGLWNIVGEWAKERTDLMIPPQNKPDKDKDNRHIGYINLEYLRFTAIIQNHFSSLTEPDCMDCFTMLETIHNLK